MQNVWLPKMIFTGITFTLLFHEKNIKKINFLHSMMMIVIILKDFNTLVFLMINGKTKKKFNFKLKLEVTILLNPYTVVTNTVAYRCSDA